MYFNYFAMVSLLAPQGSLLDKAWYFKANAVTSMNGFYNLPSLRIIEYAHWYNLILRMRLPKVQNNKLSVHYITSTFVKQF